MIEHPDLRALRGDDSPQCDAQDALSQVLDDWRDRALCRGVAPRVGSLRRRGQLCDCPRIEALFLPDTGAARRLTGDLSATICASLAALPLGHVPLRHFTDGLTSTVLIARAGGVTLSLVTLDGEGMGSRPRIDQRQLRAQSRPGNMSWAAAELIEQVDCQPTGPRSATSGAAEHEIALGSILYRDGLREARLLRRIDGALVSLRLQRRRANAEVTYEYDLDSGALLHQAAGNPRDSRVELMLAMLGRMGARGCCAADGPHRTQGECSAALRWQALRECLALDTQVGFAALAEIAADPDDALAGPAGALRAQLVEAHPLLLEFEPCPA